MYIPAQKRAPTNGTISMRDEGEDIARTAVPPRDFAALREAILARHADLPKRLAHVAGFALAHPDEVAFGTAASVAASAGVQPSTLVRLAQALGFSGFSGLQAIFRDRLRERVPTYAERLEALRAQSGKAAAAGVLLEAFAGAAVRSAEALRETCDLAQLEAAVALLARAETIYLAGQRRSFAVTAYLTYVLAKLAVKHQLLASPSGVDAELLTLAGPNDALLAFSFAPYAPGTLAAVQLAHDRAIPVVAVTDGPLSPLVADRPSGSKLSRPTLKVSATRPPCSRWP
jgi:DNA-binding MurR/RpiR family transcriptional regulator